MAHLDGLIELALLDRIHDVRNQVLPHRHVSCEQKAAPHAEPRKDRYATRPGSSSRSTPSILVKLCHRGPAQACLSLERFRSLWWPHKVCEGNRTAGTAV